MSPARRQRKPRNDRRGRYSDDKGRNGKKENRCYKQDCYAKCCYATLEGQRAYASYCLAHACQLGPPKCQRMKERGDKYCSEHATCAIDGCFVQPTRLSDETLPWHCERHKCRYPGCSCGAPSGSGLCSTHMTLCSVAGCLGQRRPDSALCEAHERATRNTASPLEDTPPYPDMHQRDAENWHSNEPSHADNVCRLPGCNQQRQTKDGGESNWCENHTCESYMCLQSRCHRQPSMRTCAQHACAVERCDRAALHHGAFCGRHGCGADNCAGYKETSSWFCHEHECARLRCTNKAVAGTDRCLLHLEQGGSMRNEATKTKPRGRGRGRGGGGGGDDDDGGPRPRDASPPVVILNGGPYSSSPWSRPCWEEDRAGRRRGSPACSYDCVDDGRGDHARCRDRAMRDYNKRYPFGD
ncbi:hypothetical protein A9K55_006191 [Cordyceps militaris]|uniref:Uncharacterized protein n=1 Tax=Cordyceps militaris TaxID=73501 RepID=A0A2H4SDB7_CORMI|nr:hypothetical protein A9K55_006191 [Cordyceps militaris]